MPPFFKIDLHGRQKVGFWVDFFRCISRDFIRVLRVEELARGGMVGGEGEEGEQVGQVEIRAWIRV